VWQH